MACLALSYQCQTPRQLAAHSHHANLTDTQTHAHSLPLYLCFMISILALSLHSIKPLVLYARMFVIYLVHVYILCMYLRMHV